MDIYTIQMAKWRVAQAQGIPLLDTTVKSGVSAFAPSWSMVLGIKGQTLSEEAYRAEYLALMRQSWVEQRVEWEKLLSMDSVALACYCKADTFCHRHLLKEIVMAFLKQRNIPFNDCGEIR